MKRFLLLLAALVMIHTGAFAQTDEFSQGTEAVKPRNDLALSLGLPGFLNLSYTRALSGRLGTRLTGGGMFIDGGHLLGAQGELFLLLDHTRKFSADLSIALGGITIGDEDEEGSASYGAICANFRVGRFVSQIGTGTILGSTGDVDDEAIMLLSVGIILARFK